MLSRITWLLPIKNGMPYLHETLASIEAQTYKNWEILAWDNGSDDGTVDELKKWIPERLPGRVITGEALTLGASLARMVEICNTELCARIDADDINLPDRLEKQLEFLSNHPEISVLGSWMYFIDEHGLQRKDLYTIPISHDDIVHEMLTRNTIAHPSVIFKRSAVLNVGNYRDRVNIEDYDLWLRIAQHYKLANLDIPLVKYRVHQNSTTQLAIKENRINQAMINCICENAPLTFSCSEIDMKLLKARNHPFAIRPILQIAKHLEINANQEYRNSLHSLSFLNSVKSLVAPKDIISRLFISSFYPHKSHLFNEIKSILIAGIKRIPIVNQIYYNVNNYRSKKSQNKKFNQWFNQIISNRSSIHLSVEFTGVNNPFDHINIKEECTIERDCTFWLSPDEGADLQLSINKRAFIGGNTYIGVFKPISIGSNTLIGAYSYIISANHDFKSRDIPIRDQGFTGAPIVIEDDVWIGTHVVVLPGVTIGEGAIIAAHSLVNKNIPPYEIWGGIPAKFIKKRP